MNYINYNKQFKTINNGILTEIDTEDKLSFIRESEEMLNEAKESGEILLLYRGENKQLFYEKTGCEYITYVNIEPYFDRFFVIGSKAISYFKKQEKIIKPIKQFDHKKKTEYVFQKLHELSSNNKFLKELTFFNDYKNKDNFEFSISQITQNNEKLSTLNFYIAFIHTLSSDPNSMNAYSPLISATKEFEFAKKYAQNGYIIGFWLTKPLISQAIDYQDLVEIKRLFDKYKLPWISVVNKAEDLEVTLFSAIFPHNIFWAYDIRNKTYVINPYLFKTNLDSLISSGINVDQTFFDSSIKGIYGRIIWRSGTCLLFEEVQDN
ncbi:MAG: hypothetical protein P9L89_04740 [Candidatus Celaenobacter polaris]|nr:hypothetical protein [Candidatus Celaenobacter polaris]